MNQIDLKERHAVVTGGAQGIGFAIPVDTVIRVAADMLSVRRQRGMWHGIIARDTVRPGDGSVLADPASRLQTLQDGWAGSRNRDTI